MDFAEQLNAYIKMLDCSAKDISDYAGLSAATLSRYRSGKRVPDAQSENFAKLCLGIATIAEKKNLSRITETSVHDCLSAVDDLSSYDTVGLIRNFDALVSLLQINIRQLSRYIGYDSSTVFRFRNGTRRLVEPVGFADAVATYVAHEFDAPQNFEALSQLLACEETEILDMPKRAEKLKVWLLRASIGSIENGSVNVFLAKLDEFNLNEYLRAINFDKLKALPIPLRNPLHSRSYFGLTGMMESELAFLKTTVLSHSMSSVTMYSDMPMEEMAKDEDFPKRWMLGMAVLLRKGLRLNQIHDLDRSFTDMMLGLESWIPMYMTGQVHPYYLKGQQSDVFHHLIKVSGAAALSGEAIKGHHGDGRYRLATSSKEVEYYTTRAKELLANAYPLMDIYRSDRINELHAYLASDSHVVGKRKSIMSTLPLYTAGEELLTKILTRNNVEKDEQQRLLGAMTKKKRQVERLIEESTLECEVPFISREEFAEHPLCLDLADMFYETSIAYSYDEYRTHLKKTEDFAAEHAGYILGKNNEQVFRNLQIRVHEAHWALVSKGNAPAIHFLIRHPKLRDTIENFVPQLVDTQ